MPSCPSCTELYPRRQGTGKCVRCVYIEKAVEAGGNLQTEIANREAKPWCRSCGVMPSRMNNATLCGTCVAAEAAAASQANAMQQGGALPGGALNPNYNMLFGHYGGQVGQQQGNPAAPMSFAATYNPQGAPASTSTTTSPNALVQATICYSSRPKSGGEPKYGTLRPSVAREMGFEDFLRGEVRKVNAHISTHGQPQEEYEESEIEPRWLNNDKIAINDRRSTIGEVWDRYLKDGVLKERYFRDPGQGQRRGNATYSVNIMLFLDKERRDARVASRDFEESSTRSRSSSRSASRSREGSVNLQSSTDAPRKKPQRLASTIHLTTTMEGFLIPIDSDLPDPDQKGSGDSIKVTRRVHPVSTQLVGPKTVFFGTVPKVGEVVFKMYKTARFEGAERDVEPDENRDFIWDDARRLAKLQSDFASFTTACKEISVSTSILAVQPVAYIFAEYGQPEVTKDDDGNETSRIDGPLTYWLVEGKLLTSCRKFCGSIGQFTQPSDPWIKLLEAFVHWSYDKRDTLWIWVDLQGAEDEDDDGGKIYVLYDPQSHTLTGDSGIGDGGEESIALARGFHTCGDICKALGLGGI